MKFSKLKLTVGSSKEYRAQRLEGEGEGRLGKEFRVEGAAQIGKLIGLFSNKAAYQADMVSAYNDNGEKVSNRGWFDLGNEGRACKLEILFGLTETSEFEDATIDCLKLKLEDGKVATIKGRLRVFPDNKQLSRIPHWIKNEITVTLNGETITAEDREDEGSEQPELELGAKEGGDEESDEPPAAGPGEVLPGVPAMGSAGPIAPPQRPARRRPGESTH